MKPSPRFPALVAAVGELDATVLAQAVPRETPTQEQRRLARAYRDRVMAKVRR